MAEFRSQGASCMVRGSSLCCQQSSANCIIRYILMGALSGQLIRAELGSLNRSGSQQQATLTCIMDMSDRQERHLVNRLACCSIRFTTDMRLH